MSTSFIRFLDKSEHYKSFLFLKNEKIDDCPLKNQADGHPSHKLMNLILIFYICTFSRIDYTLVIEFFKKSFQEYKIKNTEN